MHRDRDGVVGTEGLKSLRVDNDITLSSESAAMTHVAAVGHFANAIRKKSCVL